METDDDDNAAGFETIEQHAPQRCFELFELVIDGDAQGLKDASGRVALALLPVTWLPISWVARPAG